MDESSEWTATPELQWKMSPTPGERPTLQQKWVGLYDCDRQETPEEWRDVPSVW